MSEIPKEALVKAAELANVESRVGVLYSADNVMGVWPLQALARFIADVSEKAKMAVEQSTFAGQLPAHISPLQSLILPNPEDDLLKEAREIVRQQRRNGECEEDFAMRCTLAALKGRK